MSALTYLSRNYTEFGPFTTTEVLDFKKRAILHDSDHLRAHGDDVWITLEEWMAQVNVKEVMAVKPTAVKKTVAAAKKAVKKTEAVKKTAKKAVAKKAAKQSPEV